MYDNSTMPTTSLEVRLLNEILTVQLHDYILTVDQKVLGIIVDQWTINDRWDLVNHLSFESKPK
jgi:hypothetical protein